MLKHLRLLPGLLLCCAGLQAQDTTISSVRISTVPDGARFYVDGMQYVSAQVFLWPQGSKHIVQFPTDSSNGTSTGCQMTLDQQTAYCFNSWVTSAGTPAATNTDLTVTASPSITWIQTTLTISYKIMLRFGDYPAATNAVCGMPGDAPQDVVRPGVVYIGGKCFQTSTDVWASGTIALNAYPYPGFVFLGWNIGGQVFDSFLKSFTLTRPVTMGAQFWSAKRVQFLTSPPGMQLLIDRTITPTSSKLSFDTLSGDYPGCTSTLNLPPMPPITIPALCFGQFDFLPGSKHVFAAVTPQIDGSGKWWVFDKFSDGLRQNSAYTADYNTSVPDSIVANFVAGVQASFLTSPGGLKLSIDGRENWQSYSFIWGAGTSHTVAAAATQVDSSGRTWTFQGWSNGGPASQTIATDASTTNLRMTANYSSQGLLKITTVPAGIKLQVDGADCVTPCSVNHSTGTGVPIVAPASLPVDDSSRMDFLGWSDGGAASHTVTMNGDVQSIYANYGYSYRLALASDPAGGADFQLSPPSSDLYYPSDMPVTVSTVARSGFKFRRWGGDLAGVYNVGQLTMSGPRTVLASMDRIPYIATAGIKNAAGDTPDGMVAPGSIISIYGESLAPQLQVGPTDPLAQTIAGVAVTVGDRILPLLFVSPQQINAQLLSDLPDGDYTLTVHWTGMPDITGTFKISRNAPGLFGTAGSDNQIYAAALHEDGTPVTAASPAVKGELLTVYGTGFGPYTQKIIDGFSAPASPRIPLADPVEVDAGDSVIQPDWSGGAPGMAGTAITRFRIPDTLPSANVELRVKVNGKLSNMVILPVQ
jgi:uncharacterized protein (TIGR03437 family)